jgi:putative GTP pyrophosphokinase
MKKTAASVQERKPGEWYVGMRHIYEALCKAGASTIENLIRNAEIDYLSVTARTKSIESFLKKIERKSYKNPEKEITDLAGIRVITFIESDVPKVCDIIRSAFSIHLTESLDKSTELGIDRFGYRSVHFVCDLGEDRLKLPEFAAFEGLVFEIQVRTILQHAWAEMDHDRNYKFVGVLPTHLQRRLNLLAGMLELADREFATLAHEVDVYAQEVADKTGAGDFDIEINSTSLLQYLLKKTASLKTATGTAINPIQIEEDLIDELRVFGINTLSDLDRILTEDLFTSVSLHQKFENYVGLLRDAMMYADLDRYFDVAWSNSWDGIDDDTIALLAEKYGKRPVTEILSKYGVSHLRDLES